MQKRIRDIFKNKLKDKKGFTLLELIMVIAVISVLSTIAVIGIYGYLKAAYSLKVNQTAKTVFYAAQNYLVDQKEKGALETFNKHAKKSGNELSLEDDIMAMLKANNFTDEELSTFKKNHVSSKFRYLYLDGSKVSDVREITDRKNDAYNVLYAEVLEPYIKDTNITDNSFLVEYDSKTGVVMSVFYSEKIDGFVNGQNPYGGDTDTRYNVIKRDKKSLSDKWQGYYGVYDTNLSSESVALTDPEVCLVNGERLVLKWQDTNDTNSAFIKNPDLKKKLYFEIEITSVSRKEGDSPLSTKISKIKAGTGVPSSWEKEEDIVDKEGMPIFIYYTDEKTGQGTYELLLDCFHHAILENYSDIIASDMLKCTVTAKLEDISTTGGKKSSNLESANFGGGEEKTTYCGKDINVGGSGNTKENGERTKKILGMETGEDLSYTVNNTRHFNNVRNVTAKKDFMQTGDVNWSTIEGKPNSKIFDTFLFVKTEKPKLKPGDYSIALYEGSYRVKDNHKIIGLNIKSTSLDKGENIGIFSINGGEINGINLEASKVVGVANVGGIVGTNNKAGTVTDIKADVAVSGVYPDGVSKEEEKYANSVGGVIGVNKGTAEKLTTGERVVSGRKNVGGIIGSNESSENVNVLANGNNINVLISAKSGWENFGGITGRNTAGSSLTNCVNHGLVKLDYAPSYTTSNQPKFIGGITGYNEGTIAGCTNQDMKTDVDKKTKECIAALNRVDGKLPDFYGVFVGGIAGVNTGKKASIAACSVENAYITGNSIVGGVTGANWKGTIRAAGGQNRSDISGLIIATDNLAGGVVGYTDASLQNFANSANVFGDSMVGGITGFHGSMFTEMDEMAAYDWNAYFSGKEEETSSYYSALFAGADRDILQSDSEKLISSCRNDGFVYAKTRYSGGITGINWGKIQNSYCNMDVENSKYIYEENTLLRKADCAGGIAGLNRGEIWAATLVETDSIVYGKSFVGGVVGCNLASITGYENVAGNVYGNGNYVGGFLGLNNDANIVMVKLTKEGKGTITGKNYVAGLIGCNVLRSNEAGQNIHIQASTSNNSEVIGEAFVGGIIGYHTVNESGKELADYCGELSSRDPYQAYDIDEIKTEKAASYEIGMECDNGASVSGFRYVGGIIGFNEENSLLTVKGSRNFGDLKVDMRRMEDSNISVQPDIVHMAGESGTSYFIGGITGRNTSTGTIRECYSSGRVESPSRYLGGLCEINEGLISNCTIGYEQIYASNIQGDNSVGGLVGLNHTVTQKDAKVVNCVANQYAAISGGTNTGGLVGTNKAVVKDCTSYANVSSKGDNVGGIAGINYGNLNDNHIGGTRYSPTISGRNNVGGFVGNNQGTGGEIKNLENYANVTGSNLVGGIVGIHNASKVTDCINHGLVEATGTGTEGCAGGITGINDSKKSITGSYNDGIVISNASKAGGIAGWNKGTLKECVNEGSVRGAYQGNGNDAVGGIAGTNETGASIVNCISRINSKGTNFINGGALVGGIAGLNWGKVESTDNAYQNVTIPIQITQKLMNSNGTENTATVSYIGGILGRDGRDVNNRTDQRLLSGFTYSGTINVIEAGSRLQYIGGIIGSVDKNYTVDGCQFTGKITGQGNASNSANAGGVGGLTGINNGNIILVKVSSFEQSNRYGLSMGAADKKSTVEGKVNVGGIAGLVQDVNNSIKCTAQIESNDDNRITNYCTVKGTRNIGGIFGRLTTAKPYSYLYNQGTISGNESVGGIFGAQTVASENAVGTYLFNEKNGKILAQPDASGKAINLGGIVGSSKLILQKCENFGTIGTYELYRENQNVTKVGGVVGDASNSRIEECANSGSVYLGNASVGGIAGVGTGATIKSCYNRKTAYLDAPSVSIGGILGTMGTSDYGNTSVNIVQNCENQGTVLLRDYNRSNKVDFGVGGIIGSLFSNGPTHMNNIINCRNSGDVKMELTQTFIDSKVNISMTGGILGYMCARTNVTGCENSGTVDAGLSIKAGGIIGRYNSISVPAGSTDNIIADNVNTEEGKVLAKSDAGGIVGYHESFNGLQFQNNWNKGTISGNNNLGGLIGNLYNYMVDDKSGSIIGGGNTGTIEVVRVGLAGSGEANAIGGCFGTSSSRGITIKSVVNRGQFKIDDDITKVTNVGGIIAYGAGNIIEECRNEADIDLSKSRAEITNVGGIAGTQSSFTSGGITLVPTFRKCVNSASILGNKTDKTGGIIGLLNNGIIMACSNEAPNRTESIQGKSRVGGIAGTVTEPNTKIMGLVTAEGTEATYNEQTITGDDILGGIAGEQNRSVFYSVYNAGDVLLTTNKNAAGGIVGLSKGSTSSENTGLLINCYNIGKIGFAKGSAVSGNAISGYIGGLIGFRENSGAYYDKASRTSINNKSACISTVIKDSYHIKNQTAVTLPANSMNGEKLKEGSWAVGNEPFMKFLTPNSDSQSSDPERTGRFEWSEETYSNMLTAIKWPGLSEWDNDNEITNVQFMLDHYVYQLPVPKGQSVTGVEGYTYNMQWASQVGLNSGLQVSVYDKNYSKQELSFVEPLFAFKVSEQTTEGVNINVPEDIAKAYMGKPVYIATQAYGYTIDGIDVTLDSEKEIVKSFVLMPPLPAPAVTVTQALGTLEVTLVINNISAYLEKPNKDYPELGTIEENGMYSQYANGVYRIAIQDYYRSTETEQEVSYKMKEFEITNIDWARDTATVTVDYSKPENQLENRLYHTYRIQAAISAEDSKKSLEPSDHIEYRYLPSVKTGYKFQLKTTSMLQAPEELAYEYTGTLTEAAYKLSWMNPKVNKGNTAGYEVAVTNPQNKRTQVIHVTGEANTTCELTAADVKNLVDSFETGSTETKLTYTVKAISSNTDVKDSMLSAPGEVKLPLKQITLSNFRMVIDEPDYNPNIVRIEWDDESAEVLDTDYRITLQANGRPVSELGVTFQHNPTDTYCTVTIPRELIAAADTKLKIGVIKSGNISSSLDSNETVYEETVYKRLPAIVSASAEQVVVSPDNPNKLQSKITWSIPLEINADNCSGYLITVLPSGEPDMNNAETFRIDDPNAMETQLEFDISNMGNDMILYIYACGKGGVSSTSMFNQFSNIKLSDQRVEKSENLNVSLVDKNGDPVGDICDEATLRNLGCSLTWVNPSNSGYILRGHRLMLTDEKGKIIPLRGEEGDDRFIDIDGVTEGYLAQVDLMEYQGKRLKWSVINRPSDAGKLSSLPAEITFTVPTIPPL